MTISTSIMAEAEFLQAQKALSSWDNEGGTVIMSAMASYKRTPVFNENTLPTGLRKEHRTKPGVWGILRVYEGRLRYQVLDPISETIIDTKHPGMVLPEQPHFVEVLGPIRIQVEYYNRLSVL